MAIDLKNIVFKYVKIVAGVPSIDAAMTDAKFMSSKPVGYYKVFIFPKDNFAGVDYTDLQDIVSVEKDKIWDEVNRTTLLGYNEENNTFIFNMIAYMGLKDTDVKIDGNAKHSGQAGWYEATLSTAKSNSQINLKQTDGTDVYLTFVLPVAKNRNEVLGSICVESSKSDASNSGQFLKHSALWCKSADGISTIMGMDNFSESPTGTLRFTTKSRWMMFHFASGGSINMQGKIYGLPQVLFGDQYTNRATSICGFNPPLWVHNIDTITPNPITYKYTETSDLGDILSSGEYCVFETILKIKYVKACKAVSDSETIEIGGSRFYNLRPILYKGKESNDIYKFQSYSSPVIEGLDCDLMSYDYKNKPFLYNAPRESINILGIKNEYLVISRKNFMQYLPDGYIACLIVKDISTDSLYILRFKGGESPKYKAVKAGTIPYFVKISGATGFGTELFTPDSASGIPAKFETISKDDLINSTGFTDSADDTIDRCIVEGTSFCTTIMRI